MERQKFVCKFCGHIWLSKIEPKKCPACHNNWRNKKTIENANSKP